MKSLLTNWKELLHCETCGESRATTQTNKIILKRLKDEWDKEHNHSKKGVN